MPDLSAEALAALNRHDWRGNVRELENALHRAVLLAQDGRIVPDAIFLTGGRLAAPAPRGQDGAHSDSAAGGAARGPGGSETEAASKLVGRTVAEVERDLILDTVAHCLGNRTHAATILGISIRTLRNKLKLYSQDGVKITAPDRAPA